MGNELTLGHRLEVRFALGRIREPHLEPRRGEQTLRPYRLSGAADGQGNSQDSGHQNDRSASSRRKRGIKSSKHHHFSL